MMSELVRIQEHLANAFRLGRPAQGYLIVGSVYQEGKALAQWIGAQLLGDMPTIAEHTHPDMPWFEPEKKSRIIDVKMMHDRILPMAQQSSLSGGWKIPVIVSADRMNAKAANAFLKTLEEPPPQTLFLLLADSLAEMLPTIVSRCQVIHVGGERKLEEPWRSKILEMLLNLREKSVLLDTARADVICEVLADMETRAKKLVREERKASLIDEDEEVWDALVGAKVKRWRNDLLLMIEQWMLDLLRLKVAANDPEITLHFPECRACLQEHSERYSLENLFENMTMLARFTEYLSRNIKPEQVLPYWMERFFL